MIARPEVVLIELVVGHGLSRALHLDLTGTAGLELFQHLREPHNMAHNGQNPSRNAPTLGWA
jgi:hypothetical protein